MGTETKEKPKVIEDYVLMDNEGNQVRLSSLFGDKDYLIVLHNMGKSCPNSALWGDEFNGMLKALEKTAGFCIVGPDDPQTQKAYVKERGWLAKLYSARGGTFIKDLGFEDEEGDAMPGVSIFQKGRDGKIFRLEQTNVPKDDRAPSVLEVLWMVPDVEIKDLAWGKS
ncbi:MAG TPA: DUF899 family protein [Nitrospiria bacterium]|jgi:predicted dithiol-disulfide oxidoreductase (DUF899 family)